jgi:hypothetical protein
MQKRRDSNLGLLLGVHPTLASARERTSMSFLRHEEIYRSDVGTRQDREQLALSSLPVLIGFDEFPVGYSLAGCPPAEPASASPTRNHSPQPTLPYNYFSQSLFGKFGNISE